MLNEAFLYLYQLSNIFFTCKSLRCAKMMCNLDNILRDGTLFCEKSTTHKIVSKTTLF